MIADKVYADYVRTEFLFPYDKGKDVSWLMEHAAVQEKEYLEQGISLTADCHKADVGKYMEYVVATGAL